MQKILLFCFAVAFLACNSKKEKDSPETKTKETTPLNTSGYKLDYSSSFAMGENKNAETVLALWKAFDDNQLDPTRAFFADSVELHFYSGDMITGTGDSALAGAKQYRNMYSSVKSTVHTVFPVMSTDKNENWVCIWGREVHTMNGKTDSVELMETWRFNKEGKANLLYQYSAAYAPPK